MVKPGDYGSTIYRIPAICTMSDGSLLTATDKRKFNHGDLPSDIDIIVQRSTDGGRTWEEQHTDRECDMWFLNFSVNWLLGQ